MRGPMTFDPSHDRWRLHMLHVLFVLALFLFYLALLAILAFLAVPPGPETGAGQVSRDIKLTARPFRVDRQNTLGSTGKKTIPNMAAAASPATQVLASSGTFQAAISLDGGIGYFAGQTNQRGRTLPDNPLVFLVGERINITMDFSQEPLAMTISLNNLTLHLAGIIGKTHYETWLIVPQWARTLDWDGGRVGASLSLSLHATSRADPLGWADVTIPGLEIGGSVYDILVAQIG